MRILEVILKGIDGFTEWAGKSFAWLMMPLIAIIVFEVTCRYLFAAPTNWVFDVSFMLGTSMFLIGLSYVHRQNAHVKVDIVSKFFSSKVQMILKLIFRIIYFFPLMWAIARIALEKAIFSFKINETYQFGIWHPSMIPFRIIIFIAFFLLTLQGFSQFVRELQAVIKGRGL